MKFTDEQISAIEARGCDVLVSAGAGSGKTAVLVERILRIITDSNPVNIDRLLVVTFTDAAATQMRQRVAAQLNKRIKANPSDANLRKQLALMSKSHITTIHSFCLGVARRFFHKIDMDPGFRVADGAEIELMKAEILEATFEERYRAYYERGENPEFVRLAQIFDRGNVRDDNFRKLILDVYEFTRACANPKGWLSDVAGAYRLEDGIEESYWYGAFREYAARVLGSVSENLAHGLELAKNPNLHAKYQEVLARDMEDVKRLTEALNDSFETFCEVLEFSFGSLSGVKNKDGSEEAREKIAKIRGEAKKAVEDLRSCCAKDPALMEKDIRDNYDNVRALSQLALDFANRFSEAKREKNMADFADFEHFCLRILVDEDLRETAEARELSAEFDEIFIDEYQDLSIIQEIVLSAVSGGRRNRFMVGDVKQCIYQFRMARPDIFVEKYEGFMKDAGLGRLIYLAKNFRSRRGVLDSVNCLFSRLMSADVGGVNYDRKAELLYAANFSEELEQDFRTVLHIIEGGDEARETAEDEDLEELSAAQIEAKAVARHIRGLVDGKFQVKDGDGQRDIRYRDIVILLRSNAAAQAFAQELKNADVPAFTGGDEDFFLAQEVMVMLALLSIIDNPRQDIPLTAVLYSAIFRFSPDELVQIRGAANADFYGALRVYCDEGADTALRGKAAEFLTKLDIWRDAAARMTVSELIFYLYEQTDFYNFVGILPGGKIRRANLTVLHERAAKYEQTSYRGLFNFVRYIERLQKNNYGFKMAAVSNENEDLVRIMSIHKSKGLEYPVVFVCGLGKAFNMQDARRDFVMDFDLGVGFSAVDLQQRVSSSTFARYVIGKRKAAAQISEEMRILYVALTRAKEKLYLVGTTKKWEKGRESGPLRPYDVMRCRNFLDWILMVLPEMDESVWDIRYSDANEFRNQQEDPQKALAQAFARADHMGDGPEGRRDEVFRRLSYEYPHQAAIYAPAKMSVSEVKRLYYREFLADSEEFGKEVVREFAKPVFLADEDKIDSAGRGIIIHTVLEHIDMAKHGAQDVLAIVRALVEKKILTQEEARIVPVDSIVRFLQSDIAARMRAADVLRREMPFATAIAPGMVNMAFEGEETEEMLLHGVIDCVFEEEGRMVIVDYKTQRVRGGIEAAARAYLPQMELYQYAVERIFGTKVAQRVIYFFDRDECVVL
ncbi:MAG: helicase-exonuclease AddAB subunit AddA [Clostridiales bacterium]|jgi:ATP-dependent helicase/nuclease subunit A|nr:helicase-exonuclease AddAB subunit AddA [Clostridiales bacterium]